MTARVDVFNEKTTRFGQLLLKRQMRKIVDRVVIQAKIRAGNYTGNSVPKRNGDLPRHIRGIVSTVGKTGVQGTVIADSPTAILTHDGARRHVIAPRPGGGLLFFWRKKGRFVCIKTPVNHPGYRGRKYLTIPWRSEARKNNYKIITGLKR